MACRSFLVLRAELEEAAFLRLLWYLLLLGCLLGVLLGQPDVLEAFLRRRWLALEAALETTLAQRGSG